MTRPSVTCLLCCFTWRPYGAGKPDKCPKCQSRDWNNPYGELWKKLSHHKKPKSLKAGLEARSECEFLHEAQEEIEADTLSGEASPSTDG